MQTCVSSLKTILTCCLLFLGLQWTPSCHPHLTVNFSKMQEQFLKNEILCVDRTCNPHPIYPGSNLIAPHFLFYGMSTLNPNCRFLSSSPYHFGHISGVASHSPGHLGSFNLLLLLLSSLCEEPTILISSP